MAQLKSYMSRGGQEAANIPSATNGIWRAQGCTSTAAGAAGCTLSANSLIVVFSSPQWICSPSNKVPPTGTLKTQTKPAIPCPPGFWSYNKAFWNGLEGWLRRYKLVSKILLKIRGLEYYWIQTQRNSRHINRSWTATFHFQCHFQWTTTLPKESKMEGMKKPYVPEKCFKPLKVLVYTKIRRLFIMQI